MTLLFQDSFNRADNADLGTDWSTARTGTPRLFKIATNAALPAASANDSAEVNDTVGVLTDCWAESLLKSPGSGGVGSGCGVSLRNTSPVGANFNLYRLVGNASGYEAGKFVSNTFTSLGSGSGTTFATNDTIYAKIVGNQISALKGSLLGVGGTAFGSFSSDSAFSSGLSGISYSSNDGASTGIDSWAVGDFGVNLRWDQRGGIGAIMAS